MCGGTNSELKTECPGNQKDDTLGAIQIIIPSYVSVPYRLNHTVFLNIPVYGINCISLKPTGQYPDFHTLIPFLYHNRVYGITECANKECYKNIYCIYIYTITKEVKQQESLLRRGLNISAVTKKLDLGI